MANFPTLTTIAQKWGISSPETKSKAQLIKELSDNEEQLELLLESKRVAAAVLFRTSYILLKTLRTARYVLKQ